MHKNVGRGSSQVFQEGQGPAGRAKPRGLSWPSPALRTLRLSPPTDHLQPVPLPMTPKSSLPPALAILHIPLTPEWSNVSQDNV